MDDEEPAQPASTVRTTVLLGPDGSVYSIPDRRLEWYRVADDVAAGFRVAYGAEGGEPSAPSEGCFRILARGPVTYTTKRARRPPGGPVADASPR